LKSTFIGYNAVADNTGLSLFVFQLPPKSAKSREILRKFELQFKVIQGHRSWCQWKARVQLHISH